MTDNEKKTSKDIFGNIIEKDSRETDKINQDITEEKKYKKQNKYKKQTKYGCLIFSVFILSLAFWYLVYYFKAIKGFTVADGYMWIFLAPPFLLSLFIIFVFGLVLLNRYFLTQWENRFLIFFVFISYFFLWFVGLFGDHIVGKIYFDHLCKTKAGGHIYKTIDLPEMPVWGGKSLPMYDAKNNIRYVWDTYRIGLGIKTTHITLKQNEEMLSENRLYKFTGGWFAHAYRLGVDDDCGKCGSLSFNYFKALTINGIVYDINKGRRN